MRKILLVLSVSFVICSGLIGPALAGKAVGRVPDRIIVTFEPGIDPNAVDYVVKVERFQVERLASYAHLGDIAPEEH